MAQTEKGIRSAIDRRVVGDDAKKLAHELLDLGYEATAYHYTETRPGAWSGEEDLRRPNGISFYRKIDTRDLGKAVDRRWKLAHSLLLENTDNPDREWYISLHLVQADSPLPKKADEIGTQVNVQASVKAARWVATDPAAQIRMVRLSIRRGYGPVRTWWDAWTEMSYGERLDMIQRDEARSRL